MARRLLLLAAAAAMVLAACGDGDDAAAPTTAATSSSTTSSSTTSGSTTSTTNATTAPSSTTSTTAASTSTAGPSTSRTPTTATTAPSSAPPTAATTAPTTTPSTTPPSTTAPSTTASASRTPQGFGLLGVTIQDAGGASRAFCLWLADTAAKQQQGLMQVTDLGGKAGMIFAYKTDSTSRFWMYQTVMPLSIAFFDESGAFVSSADMQPCPGESTTCPTYPALGRYRDAIEVPLGSLPSMGIGPGSAIVGRGSCPA